MSHPIDLSKNSLYPISIGCTQAAAWCKPHLDGDSGARFVPLNDAIEKSDAPSFDGTDILTATIEKRPDQSLLFQPEGTRKALKRPSPGRRAVTRHVIVDRTDGLLAAFLIADGQLRSSLSTAALDYVASALAAHAGPKAVLVCSFAAAGLVRSFHDEVWNSAVGSRGRV